MRAHGGEFLPHRLGEVLEPVDVESALLVLQEVAEFWGFDDDNHYLNALEALDAEILDGNARSKWREGDSL